MSFLETSCGPLSAVRVLIWRPWFSQRARCHDVSKFSLADLDPVYHAEAVERAVVAKQLGNGDTKQDQNWGLPWHRNAGIKVAVLESSQLEYRLCLIAAILIGCLVIADPSVAGEPVVNSHLVLWLDAQDVDGKGGQGNKPVDGTPLAHWADKSGRGNHAVQPVADRRPEYVKRDADTTTVSSDRSGSSIRKRAPITHTV